jgi:hydrogenase maturation protease
VEAEHEVRRRVGVVGLGNVLMGDDAFGPWVVQTLLAEHDFPAGVEVQDLGTPGLDLTPYVTDLDALVLVDTVRASGPAGTVRGYRRDELLKHSPRARLSPHDPGVKEALLFAEFAGRGPREVLLVGAVPETTAMGVCLSPALRSAVPIAAEAVLQELERLGVPARRKSVRGRTGAWWASPPAVDPAVRGGEAEPGGAAAARV